MADNKTPLLPSDGLRDVLGQSFIPIVAQFPLPPSKFPMLVELLVAARTHSKPVIIVFKGAERLKEFLRAFQRDLETLAELEILLVPELLSDDDCLKVLIKHVIDHHPKWLPANPRRTVH